MSGATAERFALPAQRHASERSTPTARPRSSTCCATRCGLKGTRFALRQRRMRRLFRAGRRSRGRIVHTAAMGGRRQSGHDGRGPAGGRRRRTVAAGVHRRAGRAMRLLHVGNADQRGGAARAHAPTYRSRGQAARSIAILPLRQLQPGRARGAARAPRSPEAGESRLQSGERRGCRHAAAREPARESAARAMAQVSRRRIRRSVFGQGGDRPGNPDRTGADRGGRARTSRSIRCAWCRRRRRSVPTRRSLRAAFRCRSRALRCAMRALKPVRSICDAAAARLGAHDRIAHVSTTAASSARAAARRATGSSPTTNCSTATLPDGWRPKPASAHRIVGAPIARLDLADKVFGAPCFIHDLELPRMLHGRVLRPPSADASAGRPRRGKGSRSAGCRRRRSRRFVCRRACGKRSGCRCGLEGARGGRDMAPGRDPARRSGDGKRGSWRRRPRPASSTAKPRSSAATGRTDHEARAIRDPISRTARSGRRARWRNRRQPDCVSGRTAREFSICAGISRRRWASRRDTVVVAARARRRLLRPQRRRRRRVRRGPARARCRRPPGARAVVARGRARVVAVRPGDGGRDRSRPRRCRRHRRLAAHDLEQRPHVASRAREVAGAARGLASRQALRTRLPAINPPIAGGGGADRNSIPLYTFPAWQIVNHCILAMPLRASALRSLGAYANVFAIESFIDEVAARAGVDPVAFRLRYLDDPRARAVHRGARAQTPAGAGGKSARAAGHGIGFARYKSGGAYCAVVAEVEAEAEIRVHRLVIAVDVGSRHQSRRRGESDRGRRDPGDELDAQGSGALRSRAGDQRQLAGVPDPALLGERRRSRSRSCRARIVRRWASAKRRRARRAAAIANAVFDALGIRVRELPLTGERIRAAME